MQKSANDNKTPYGAAQDDRGAGHSAPVEPDRIAENMARVMEDGSRALATMIERSGGTSGPISEGVGEASAALASVYANLMSDPTKFAEAQTALYQGYASLWNNQVARMMGGAPDPVAKPEPGDNRFKDADWQDNPYFDFVKQFYLLSAKWSEDLVHSADGVDDATRQRAEFYLRQLSSALAPTNFVATNPEVLRETFASQGDNLVKGMEQFLSDVERSGDMLKIAQTDLTAFKVGENLATTPGKVVFQNDVMQLIQYEPTTEEVYFRPLLLTPPWINKFYVLDLVPQKSFIKYCVDQGFTVFVISWVNPDERHADKSFEQYMREGILTASDVACEITGADKANVLGYCVGGTLLGTTLAWLAAGNEEPFASATFLTTQLDFTDAGDLMVFVNEAHIQTLEKLMAQKGYLDGSRMANAFNMLRPRDLIWPYVVNNYLLGKKPFPFDLLFWNQDSSRMPAANHSFYLREFYQNNKLAQGTLQFAGRHATLGRVEIPIYELATKEDHIAPAPSVFTGSRLFGGPVDYVLSGSGHIAGVVNPPEKHKYQFWTGPDPREVDSLQDWMGASSETAGSWWPHWTNWLAEHSNGLAEPRIPGEGPYEAIEDAPGSYVLAKA